MYPNCIAPAVPIESQDWWSETESPQFPEDDPTKLSGLRHLHMGICSPNARALDGGGVTVDGIQDFTAVVTMHNNPGKLNWVGLRLDPVSTSGGDVYVREHDSSDPSNIEWETQSSTCTGGHASCVSFNPPLTCENRGTCTFAIPMRVDTGTCAHNGLCEMRIRPNVKNIEPRNDRQFTTNNSQIYIEGSNPKNKRSSPAPIGRGWYTDLEYANVSIDNYMDFYEGRSDISVPIVSGTIPLRIKHREGDGTDIRSKLRIDPKAHIDDEGILVYDLPGLFDGTHQLDTTTLSNGKHTLFLSTHETNDVGENIGILKLFIDVQN